MSLPTFGNGWGLFLKQNKEAKKGYVQKNGYSLFGIKGSITRSPK